MMPFKSYQTLQLQREGAVLRVRLNRPDVRNAFDETVIDELMHVFQAATKDASVRIVVLSGKGPVFCAGGDLRWMERSVKWTLKQNLADTRKLSRLFALMNECPKPVLGAIHGAAIGGGVGLVSVCDIAIATEATEFSLSEVRLGIIPACIGPFVVAKVGASHARALFVSAERFRSKRALEIGLIHEVVADEAKLEQRIVERTQKMLECGPLAIQHAKKLVLDLSWPERRKKISNPLDMASQVLAKIRISPEGREGVRAFLEKRVPSWLKK